MRLTPYILLISGSLVATNTLADEYYKPVEDPLTTRMCGTCHLAFSPQMLPARSWEKIMQNLDQHFGKDASLDAESTKKIESYLKSHAADNNWIKGKFMRGLGDTTLTPIRITETPYWIRKHDKRYLDYTWSNEKVQSKANCLACHPRAARGGYDDD